MKEGKDALMVNHKGDSIWGKAEVDLDNKWVQIRSERGFRSMAFRKVRLLRLYNAEDNSVTSYRRYYRDAYNSELLEQIIVGSMHFLRRTKSNTYADDMGTPMFFMINEVEEDQYFIWHSGKLLKIRNFKKQFLSLLNENEIEKITNFKKENKLQYYENCDQALIVNYYNDLYNK